MSRTDEILAAVQREIDVNRSAIDASPNLTSISLIVYMERNGGRPESVAFRTESKTTIPRGPRGSEPPEEGLRLARN